MVNILSTRYILFSLVQTTTNSFLVFTDMDGVALVIIIGYLAT
jgi:hypothetical protein